VLTLVTGATGHVGGELVTRLASAGAHRVRAMTRRPDSAAAAALRATGGVEVVRGDADDPAGLAAACRGVDRVFLMSAEQVGHGEPGHLPRLVRAAQRAGVRHLVLLSVYSGGRGADVIGDWNGRLEDAVTGSGLGWTLLRPGRFMSNALHWAPAVRRGDLVPIPFARRPAASIDPADIAEVAAVVLTAPAGHVGAAYQLSGPELLTPTEELAVLAELLGRPLRALEPPPAQVRAGLARGGTPPAVVDAILARAEQGDEGTALLPTVARLLGRPPATFAQWAARHLTAFRTSPNQLEGARP